MLTSIPILPIYSTPKNSMANEFYIPVLSKAVSYKRVSCYFSSRALVYFSEGILGLYQNGGKYNLLISSEVSDNDFRLMKEGYVRRTKSWNKVSSELENLKLLDPTSEKKISNLAYLIELGLVDIKIGFARNGLFHSKYGIIQDATGNMIYFSGSFNETESAFTKNFESITVLKSWDSDTTSKLLIKEDVEFDELWSNKNQDSMVFVKEIQELVKSKIITFSKGKFIMDSSLLVEDSLILYFDDKVRVQNNLLNVVVVKDRTVKRIMRKYIVDGEEGLLWDIKPNLSYKEVENLINLLQRLSTKQHFDFIVSDSIYDFINNSKFEIDEIARRGVTIKNKDEIYHESFDRFNEILFSEMDRPLRPVQQWVSFYMANMKRVANFSVPGAGKTAMIYGTFAYLSSLSVKEVDKIVVIGPKNSFKSWKDEFKLVFGQKRNLNELDIHSFEFRREMLQKNVNQYNLFLFNYESLVSYKEELTRIVDSRTMLVFDEVHKIKGIDSIRSKFPIELSQQAKYRFVLTGTPIPNSYVDIYNFLQILYKNEYKSFFDFSIQDLKNNSIDLKERINTKLYPFFWRVTKRELIVPEANEDELFFAQVTDKEQAVIDLLWRKYGREPFKLYIRLIQLSSNPSLLKKNISMEMFSNVDEDEDGLTFEYLENMKDVPLYSNEDKLIIDRLSESTKFAKCLRKAESLIDEGKVIIIWCIFVDTILKVKENLSKRGYRVAVIYGQTSSDEREKIITDYQKGYYDVLVTNPHTLAESVSLHMICHDALYLEYSFNLTHMLQSRDRIHRLGLKENQYTKYYYFVSEGQDGKRDVIDRKIYNRLKEKEKIMIDAIEGNLLDIEYSIDERQEILNLMLDKEN